MGLISLRTRSYEISVRINDDISLSSIDIMRASIGELQSLMRLAHNLKLAVGEEYIRRANQGEEEHGI